jgi:hypothetical protein
MMQSTPLFSVNDIVLLSYEPRGQLWIQGLPSYPFRNYSGHLRWIDLGGGVHGKDGAMCFENSMRICPDEEIDVEYWALWRMKN